MLGRGQDGQGRTSQLLDQLGPEGLVGENKPTKTNLTNQTYQPNLFVPNNQNKTK